MTQASRETNPIHPVAINALWLGLVLAVGAAGFWLLKRWRGADDQDRPDLSALLTNFRELHTRGGLSDEEYRTIKTKLAAQLQDDMGVLLEELEAGEDVTRISSSAAEDAGQNNL